MRLFAAIKLPLDAEDVLDALLEGLPEGRPVPPENMHVTLAFLDECNRHVAADLDAGLAAIHGTAPELCLDGLGMFGEGRPRVLYAALRSDPALTRLREKVLRVAHDAGVPQRRERFTPHVTIARFSNGAGRGPRMSSWLAARAGLRWGPRQVSEFSLFRSDLGSGGPVYTELARYSLDDRAGANAWSETGG
ncbi:MAG: RNA 2',3'-cyclic phosphodiesterase [Pseudomonadota bacterium]